MTDVDARQLLTELAATAAKQGDADMVLRIVQRMQEIPAADATPAGPNGDDAPVNTEPYSPERLRTMTAAEHLDARRHDAAAYNAAIDNARAEGVR